MCILIPALIIGITMLDYHGGQKHRNEYYLLSSKIDVF